MMKLYYETATSSLASHIVAKELGIPLSLEQVNFKTKMTSTGVDFFTVNPIGFVPALQLDDGQVLTEGAAILQLLGDMKPEMGLVPANGTIERYRLQEALIYIASDIHKQFAPLFDEHAHEELKKAARLNLI